MPKHYSLSGFSYLVITPENLIKIGMYDRKNLGDGFDYAMAEQNSEISSKPLCDQR